MNREECLVNSISVPDDSPPLAIIADQTLDINLEGQKPKRKKSHKSKKKHTDESDDFSVYGPVKELVIPLMMSAIGNLGAGLILDRIQYWKVFLTIPQLIALVPALLGLKGNVEMTLSSRLTTQAHLGHLNDRKIRRKFLLGNLALAQAQASGVGLLAPIIAIGISCFQGKDPDSSDNHMINWPKALLTISASVVTSAIADLLLASTMCTIIIMTYFYCKVDVDNIATPIAASLGDLVTMGFLSGISLILFRIYNDPSLHWLLGMPILFYLIVLSIVTMIARRNPYTSKQIIFGWNPLVVSMLIQNLSGMVMERFIREFPRMAVFQPIINGFGGNLVALQSSRVGTDLHKNAQKKEMINQSEKCCSLPWVFFFGKSRHGRLASVMVLIAAPFQMPFIIAASTLAGKSYLTPLFFLTYYVVSTAQVIVILYVGYCFVSFLWLVGINPDNSAIPILTALADLLGCLLLAFGFLFMAAFNDPNTIPDFPPPFPSNSTVFY